MANFLPIQKKLSSQKSKQKTNKKPKYDFFEYEKPMITGHNTYIINNPDKEIKPLKKFDFMPIIKVTCPTKVMSLK